MDASKKKGSKQRGLHDWRRQTGEGLPNMQESKTPYNGSKKDGPNSMKKATSLFEARQRHKTDRARNERFKKSDNFNETKEDEGVEIAKVPRLNPTKSSPVNDYPQRKDDLKYSLSSYRHHDDQKLKDPNYETLENWEVSRIEKNSEFEK